MLVDDKILLESPKVTKLNVLKRILDTTFPWSRSTLLLKNIVRFEKNDQINNQVMTSHDKSISIILSQCS
jgi:hypothetical protein